MDELEVKAACAACGADVRPGSLFCYNCGGKVAVAKAEEKEKKELIVRAPDGSAGLTPAPGLRSAASLRQRRSSFSREPKRIAWVPPSGTSDRRFVVVTILIFVFTLLLTAIAFYLR